MSTVKEADAKAAYSALMDFKDVVKAHPITASTPASTVSSDAASKIGAAAGKLSAAAYPLVQGSRRSSPHGHRQCRCEARDLGQRLRGHQRRPWEGDRLRADFQGDGCLQCVLGHCEPCCPQLLVLVGEPERRTEGL